MWFSSKNPEVRELQDMAKRVPADGDVVIIPNEGDGMQLLSDAAQDKLAQIVKGISSNAKALQDIKTPEAFIEYIAKEAKAQHADIPRAKIEKFVNESPEIKALFENKDSSWSAAEWGMRLGLTAAGLFATYWIAPAYSAIAARYIYTQAFGAVYGMPSAWNPVYWAAYLPGREYVGTMAYQYSGQLMSAIGLPIFHKGVDAAKYAGNTLYGYGAGLYNWMTGANEQIDADANDHIPMDAIVGDIPETDFAAIDARIQSQGGLERDKPHFFSPPSQDVDSYEGLVELFSNLSLEEAIKPASTLTPLLDKKREQSRVMADSAQTVPVPSPSQALSV